MGNDGCSSNTGRTPHRVFSVIGVTYLSYDGNLSVAASVKLENSWKG